MDISNKTKRPLRVPLPGGKRLFLGPGKTGQITPKAAEFPALKKLADEGSLEIVGGGTSKGSDGSGGNTGLGNSQSGGGGGGVRHTGDR